VTAALRGAVEGAALASGYTAHAQANDLFEAFLLATLVAEARTSGWTVWFEDPTEAPTRSILLRSAPGSFIAPSVPFTHAVLSRSGAMTLEAHVGVGVVGASGTTHEADLLVLPKFVGQDCRDRFDPPSVGKALMIAEAKYVAAPTLPLGYGRAVLGLDRDLRGIETGVLVSSRPNPKVEALLDRWDVRFVGDVLPTPGVINDTRLRLFLRESLEVWQSAGRNWRTAPKRHY
jgi:hypothetical protein